MRRVLLPLAAALFCLIVAGILLNRIPVPIEFAGPGDLDLSCPFSLVRQDGRGESHDVRWEISLTHIGGREADIRPSSWTDVTTPEDGGTCLLDIRRPPVPPYDGMDWRIGHAMDRVADLRGKTIQARILVLADRGISFSSASFYTYDGVKVTGVPVSGLPAQWQEFKLTTRVDDQAQVFELWLRLTLHGSISTGARIWFGGAQVTVLPD